MPASNWLPWRDTEWKAMWQKHKDAQWNEGKLNSLLTYHQEQKVLRSYSPQRASLLLESQKHIEDGKRYWQLLKLYLLIYSSSARQQMKENNPVVCSVTDSIKLNFKYSFSFSHQEPNPRHPRAENKRHLLCRSRPDSHWALSQSAVGVSASWKPSDFPPSPFPWRIP